MSGGGGASKVIAKDTDRYPINRYLSENTKRARIGLPISFLYNAYLTVPAKQEAINIPGQPPSYCHQQPKPQWARSVTRHWLATGHRCIDIAYSTSRSHDPLDWFPGLGWNGHATRGTIGLSFSAGAVQIVGFASWLLGKPRHRGATRCAVEACVAHRCQSRWSRCYSQQSCSILGRCRQRLLLRRQKRQRGRRVGGLSGAMVTPCIQSTGTSFVLRRLSIGV